MTFGAHTCPADRGAFDNGFSTEMRALYGRRMNIMRRFHAEAERVFNAWINPELACLWLFRSPASAAGDFDFDLRIGGSWKVSDRNDPAKYAAVGRYLAIEPPHRLVFTMAMPQFAADYDHVVVEIMPDDQGCILTLHQEWLAPSSEESFRNGWNAMFDDLVFAVS
jgi:uncharacterized protein YndB with AHSA1/START domain